MFLSLPVPAMNAPSLGNLLAWDGGKYEPSIGMTWIGTTLAIVGSETVSGTLAVSGTGSFNGALLVANGASANTILRVGNLNVTNAVLSSTSQQGIIANLIGSSAATVSIRGFATSTTTDAAAFTCPAVTNYFSANTTKGAGSTITRHFGFSSTMPTQGGTGNFGYYCGVDPESVSVTGNWGFYSETTNPNLFAGVSTIGTIGSSFTGNVIAGVQSGAAAISGQVGETIESQISTFQNAAATATYLALTSITLTPGDWIISASAEFLPNGATITVDGNTVLAVGTTSASSTGTNAGYDRMISSNPTAAGNRHQIVIPAKRVNISASTTYYLNVQATYTAGTPQFIGSITATRIR